MNEHVEQCPLCDRELGTINIDEHHLVPRQFKGKHKEPIHRICHRKIHATFTERELEKLYHTWEMLREHEQIQKFVKWIAKKDPSYYDGSKETKQRKGKRRR